LWRNHWREFSGSLAGSSKSDHNLGLLGNSIAGVVGGGIIAAFVSFSPPTSGSHEQCEFHLDRSKRFGRMGGLMIAVVTGLIKSRIGETEGSGTDKSLF
jgi:hypothetical protein